MIADQVHADPRKGPPLTFPAHLHSLCYDTPPITWFDAVAAGGWGDQPTYGQQSADEPSS
ncbi:MAG: hypothetical protein WAV90_11640 [Gordonia amarae]